MNTWNIPKKVKVFRKNKGVVSNGSANHYSSERKISVVVWSNENDKSLNINAAVDDIKEIVFESEIRTA